MAQEASAWAPVDWDGDEWDAALLDDLLLPVDLAPDARASGAGSELHVHGGGEAQSPDATSAGEGSGAETAAEKKARMAAACRKHRAKRKEEVNGLKRKNEALELERELFLEKIAQLQTDAQMLRDHGAVDIAKENELLRAEIRQHKRFMRTILAVAQKAPAVTGEERVRLLAAGIGSAVGQTLGLCYTSVSDPSWKQGPLPGGHNMPRYLAYQHLPLPVANVVQEGGFKRINVRADFPRQAQSTENFIKALWKLGSSEQAVREYCARLFPEGLANIRDIKLSEVLPPEGEVDWQKENIRLFHYEESYTDRPKGTDTVAAASVKKVTIYPSAFPAELWDADGANIAAEDLAEGPLEAFVFVTCASQACMGRIDNVRPADAGVQRLDKPILESYVMVPLPDGKTHVTYIASFPIDPTFSMGFSEVVAENGALTPLSLTMLEALSGFVELLRLDPPAAQM